MAALLTSLLLHTLLAQSGPPVAVYKCLDANGKLSYQQKPCPKQTRSERLTVPGDIDPALAEAARARTAESRPKPAQTQTQPTQEVARIEEPPPPPVRCPATRENPGVINVIGNDPWSMAIARSIYNELPSVTTLRNTGRWPKGCVR